MDPSSSPSSCALGPSRPLPFRGRAPHCPDRLPGPQDAPLQAVRSARWRGRSFRKGRGSHLDPCGGPGRAARPSAGWRPMHGCSRRPHTMTGELEVERRVPQWQSRCAERERLTGRQESVSLRRPRSEVTWENGAWHSGSRGFADTEEVTGSNPVAPTIKALTSGNAAALIITALASRDAGQLAVRGRFGGPCTGWRAFPILNLPVHGPARPRPAHQLLRAAPVGREALVSDRLGWGCASGSPWAGPGRRPATPRRACGSGRGWCGRGLVPVGRGVRRPSRGERAGSTGVGAGLLPPGELSIAQPAT